MVDPQTQVARPGTRLIVPETVVVRLRVKDLHRIGQSQMDKLAILSPTFRATKRVITPAERS